MRAPCNLVSLAQKRRNCARACLRVCVCVKGGEGSKECLMHRVPRGREQRSRDRGELLTNSWHYHNLRYISDWLLDECSFFLLLDSNEPTTGEMDWIKIEGAALGTNGSSALVEQY